MARGLPKSYIKKYGISKKAWIEYRKSKAGKKKKGKTNKATKIKTRTIRMVRKKNRRRNSFTLPILPVIGIIAMPDLGEAFNYARQGDFSTALVALRKIIGIQWNGQFQFDLLVRNLLPPIMGLLAHRAMSMLGVNRILGRARVPVLRL